MEKLTSCGINHLPEILKSEQGKNIELKEKLNDMIIPKEVHGIHITQEEISTLSSILKLRQKQWSQIQNVIEIQKQKQKGKKF